jgi:hypothetical protein
VNLFDFLQDDHPELLLNNFVIRFDASRWPPTNDGRQALMGHLQATVEHNGTILIRDGKGHLARLMSRSQGPLITYILKTILVVGSSFCLERAMHFIHFTLIHSQDH